MRHVRVLQPPQHLCLCLKRNAYDVTAKTSRKILTNVLCPAVLDVPGADTALSTPYALYAVVIHSGR